MPQLAVVSMEDAPVLPAGALVQLVSEFGASLGAGSALTGPAQKRLFLEYTVLFLAILRGKEHTVLASLK